MAASPEHRVKKREPVFAKTMPQPRARASALRQIERSLLQWGGPLSSEKPDCAAKAHDYGAWQPLPTADEGLSPHAPAQLPSPLFRPLRRRAARGSLAA